MLTIDQYSHGLCISNNDPRAQRIVADFCRRFIHLVKEEVWRGHGYAYVLRNKGQYLLLPKSHHEVRIHINALPDLLQVLRNNGYVEGRNITINRHIARYEDFAKVEFKYKSDKVPKGNQQEVIDFILDPNKSSVALEVQTGKGKTYIALYAGYLLGLRMGLFFKGGYTQRWLDAIEEDFDLDVGDVCVVKGVKGLIKLIGLALNKEPLPKIIIFTHKTLRFLLDDYVELTKIYNVEIYDFFKLLGIGYFVTDEVHQEFLLNVKRECTTHIYKTVSLSATLCPTDKYIRNMMEFVYPPSIRTKGGDYDKYISSVCIFYDYKREYAPKIRYRSKRKSYSHNEYEQWILSDKLIKVQYMRMIKDIIKEKYINVKIDKQKTIVFCASVEMCTKMTEYLQFYFEDLVVNRFCDGDPDENYLLADITVSTPQSGGTAIDIPDLISVFLTVAIDSQIANEQIKGRLRRLKNYPELTPVLYYLTCISIIPQMRYYKNKVEFFKDTTLMQVKTKYHDLLG